MRFFSYFKSVNGLPLICTAIFYIWLGYAYLPLGFHWSPDTSYKRLQAENIRFTPQLDTTIQYQGQWLDPEIKYFPLPKIFYFVQNGEIRLAQSPAISLLSFPLIKFFGDYGERLIPIIFGILTVYLTGKLSEEVGLAPAWATMLVVGLATPLLIYSVMLWEHSLVAALGVGATLLILKRKELWLAGVLTGFAFAIRKEMLFFFVALEILVIWKIIAAQEWRRPRAWQPLLTLGLGFTVVTAVYEIIIFWQTGNWLPPELRINTPLQINSQPYLLTHGVDTLRVFLFDEGYGTLGNWLTALTGLYLLIEWRWREHWRELGQIILLGTLGLGVFFFTWGQWHDYKLYGMLSVSPFLLLGGAKRTTNRSSRELQIILALFFVMSFIGRSIVKADEVPTIGPEWGLRYFLIIFILGIPLALNTLYELWQSKLRAAQWQAYVGLSLVCLNVLILMRGAQIIRDTSDQLQQTGQVLLRFKEKQIVTNHPWISAHAPQVFLQKDFFWTETREDLRQWIANAFAHEVREFIFTTYEDFPEAEWRTLAPKGGQLSVSNLTRHKWGLLTMHLKITPTSDTVYLETIATHLDHPTYLASANDGTGRLFVAERTGQIWVIQNSQLLTEPFLDLRPLTRLVLNDPNNQENGLLSFTFHPNYKQNGYLYVAYTNVAGDLMVTRYQRSQTKLNQVEAASAKIILQLSFATSIHRGGLVQFGPDGYLYLSVGDGGPEGDPNQTAQNLGLLYGKILRLDVNTETAPYLIPPTNPFANQPNIRPEIWHYGFRNPWQFSFDPITQDLFIGDVGYRDYEEIDWVEKNKQPGLNFGWSLYEGTHLRLENATNTVSPIIEINHNQENFCAVISGTVYRGEKIKDLQGKYLFGDFCSGRIFTATHLANGSWPYTELRLSDNLINLSAFGTDETGELYALDYYAGKVFKFSLKP